MGGEGPVFDLKRPAPGIQMCCICFEYRTRDELAVDPDGQVWDVCKGKCAADAGIAEQAEGHEHGR